MIRVGIIGGSGYTGGELLRLFVQHPDVRRHHSDFAGARWCSCRDCSPLSKKGFMKFRFVKRRSEGSCRTIGRRVSRGPPTGPQWELCRTSSMRFGIIDLSADYRLGRNYAEVYGPAHRSSKTPSTGCPSCTPRVAHADLLRQSPAATLRAQS